MFVIFRFSTIFAPFPLHNVGSAVYMDKYTDIPWHAIYGMRNIISHEYANIDETVIISIINEDLPKLKNVVEELLKQYTKSFLN